MVYNVKDYGIFGDGITDNTRRINELSDRMAKSGGVMYFPAGEYVTGTVFLHSNMTLYIDTGAVILGSESFDNFPMIEEDGYTRGGHWGLISALWAENITVTGGGRIDGRGYYWWKSGKNDCVRPRTVSFIKCRNVTVSNIKIYNSPCWTLHPMCCENVSITGVSIFNPYDSPNTDGINPESCKNVRISDCHIDVGDDCVTIKSGTEEDLLQKQYPCENVIITNCTMAHGHGGVVFGSEMSGGVKNVSVSNCIFQNTDRGIRIKTRRNRGGYVQGLSVNNIVMENVLACITVNEYYVCGNYTSPKEELFDPEAREVNDLTPVISDVNISSVIARNVTGVGIYLYGLPEMPVRNVSVNNVQIEVSGSRDGIDAVMAYDREKSYGEGIFLENTRDIQLNGVSITCPGEKLTVKNSENVILNGEMI